MTIFKVNPDPIFRFLREHGAWTFNRCDTKFESLINISYTDSPTLHSNMYILNTYVLITANTVLESFLTSKYIYTHSG